MYFSFTDSLDHPEHQLHVFYLKISECNMKHCCCS